MNRRMLALLVALVWTALMAVSAAAENNISTTLVMRVSHMTQSAVVNEGEDLSMEVEIEGVSPAAYQWYFEGQPIQGANQKVYNVLSARTEDSGTYRLDAMDASGKLLVSMDISARVLGGAVPRSGDGSPALQPVLLAMGLAAALLTAGVVRLRAR